MGGKMPPEYYREYRAAHLEQIREKGRLWMAKKRAADPVADREAQRRYRDGPKREERLAKNRERSLEYYHNVRKHDPIKRAASIKRSIEARREKQFGVTATNVRGNAYRAGRRLLYLRCLRCQARASC